MASAPTSIDEASTWLRKAFDAEASRGVRVHYRIDLGGEAGGTLSLRVADGGLEVSRGPCPDPDVVLTLSASDFYGILCGRENPDMLFLADRLGIEGELSLALKLRSFFNGPS